MHFTKKTLAAFFSILSLTAILLFPKAKFDAKNYSPLALMTIITNSTINWADGNIDNEINSSNTTINFYKLIEDSVNENLTLKGFKLVPKSDIINSSEYKQAEESNYYIGEDYASITGYRRLPEKNKASILIKEKTGAKAFAYVTVFIEKEMDEGYKKNGTMRGKVTAFVDITNENGKLISNAQSSEYTSKVIQIVDGKYNYTQFAAMYPDTIRAAITNATAALK